MYVCFVLYLAFCVNKFLEFLDKSDLISKTNEEGHLEWAWSNVRNSKK
jgi:hypothetical protein